MPHENISRTHLAAHDALADAEAHVADYASGVAIHRPDAGGRHGGGQHGEQPAVSDFRLDAEFHHHVRHFIRIDAAKNSAEPPLSETSVRGTGRAGRA